jgi:hypothetical protein
MKSAQDARFSQPRGGGATAACGRHSRLTLPTRGWQREATIIGIEPVTRAAADISSRW